MAIRKVRLPPVADMTFAWQHHPMSGLISITGAIPIEAGPAEKRGAALQHLASSLNERFDYVETNGSSVHARVVGMNALVLRGRRSHPMLPFDSADVTLESIGSSAQLRYELGLTFMVMLYIVLAVGFSLFRFFTGQNVTAASAVLFGFAFAVGLALLNFLIAIYRGPSWLEQQWAAGIHG